MAATWSSTMALKCRPSASRALTVASSASERPASMVALRACSSASLSSGSTTSSTPLMASRASGCGGAVARRAARPSSAASTWASAASLSLRRVSPSLRFTFRLMLRLPRVMRLPTASRIRTSSPSWPGGSRSRKSRPRPLTERISQCQLMGPRAPSERAKPVMLLIVMSASANVKRLLAPALRPGTKRGGTLVAETLPNKERAREPGAASAFA